MRYVSNGLLVGSLPEIGFQLKAGLQRPNANPIGVPTGTPPGQVEE